MSFPFLFVVSIDINQQLLFDCHNFSQSAYLKVLKVEYIFC